MIALTPDLTIPWWEWGWTDITDYVRWEPGITVTYGRSDQDSRVTSLNADMTLDNRDSRFSRANPFSPYAGYLDRATPIWSQVNPGSGWITVLQGYVNSWPKRWDTTGNESNIPITIGGIMRRFTITDEAKSPMARSMGGFSASGCLPLVYYPMEDGENAAQFANAVPGGVPLTLVGASLAVDDSLPGSRPLPTFDSEAYATAVLPAYTDTGQWVAQIAVVPTSPMVGGAVSVISVETINGKVAGGIEANNGQLVVAWWTQPITDTPTSTVTIALPDPEVVQNRPVSVVLRSWADTAGGDDHVSVTIRDGQGTELGTVSDTTTVGFHTPGVRVNVSGNRNGSGLAGTFGHLGIWADPAFTVGDDDVPNAAAMAAHDGETAVARQRRECGGAGVPFYCTTDESARLGPQPEGTLQEVLDDAAKGDGGVLYEHEFGYGYKPFAEFLLPPVALALDQALGQVAGEIEADDDDTRFVNQFTAKRPDGSFATCRDPAYQAGKALVTGQDTFNVYADNQLLDHASLAVAHGTLEADRWPRISLNLANHPELITGWAAFPQFGRLTVANPFEQAAVGNIDVIAEGATVHVNSRQWDVDLNASPAQLFNSIGTWGSDDGSDTDTRWGADDTTLAAAITDTQTSITVNTGDDVWAIGDTISEPETFPFNVDIGPPIACLTYSCTAITGTHPNLTLTIVRLGTDRPWLAETSVRVTDTGTWG